MDIEFKVSPWGDDSTHDYETSDFRVQVIINGVEAGYGLFYHQDFYIYCQEVEIYRQFRRKGVATRLYDFAESLTGKPIKPTGDIHTGLNSSGEDALSAKAQRFWRNRLGK